MKFVCILSFHYMPHINFCQRWTEDSVPNPGKNDTANNSIYNLYEYFLKLKKKTHIMK